MEEVARKFTVLLVEHEWPLIRSVKEALENDREFIYLGAVENRDDLEEFIKDCPPDIVLVDIRLPVFVERNGISTREYQVEEGMSVISLVKDISPQSCVVPFSDYVPERAKEAIKAGADAFLPKQEGPNGESDWEEWFRYKLRSIAKGTWVMDAALARLIATDEEKWITNQDAGVDHLSNRELDVLRLLAERKEDKEIAATLYISPATVRSHIKNIIQKMHAQGRKDAVKRYKRQQDNLNE
jgi:DNA-binding NarL/FixJ family response regulator